MKTNKALLLLSACGLLGSLVGCTSNSQNEAKVWTTYSTAKVIQQTNRNEDFFDTGDVLKIKMMREESESSQIIITSKQKQSLDLIKTDLVDKQTGNVLPADKIGIYLQKYLRIDFNKHSPQNKFFRAGDKIPDMLLPLEYAKQSGENFVEEDSNQGITVEVDSYDVPAGHYEGVFTLKIGATTKEVPIDVTVWDFVLEGKSAFQTCWLIYSMYMYSGEYDASEAMMDTYSDFLAKYKANPYVIQEAPMNSPEALMQDVKRMWNIKNYNSIIIPYDFPLDYDPNSYQGDLAASYIVKIAEESTEENFYLDYALFYPSTYDEADAIAEKKAASPDFFKKGGNYEKTLEKAIKKLEAKGYFKGKSEEWNERVKTAIRNIPDVFTNVNLAEDWVKEYPATFCPQINVLDSQRNQELYKDFAKLNANGDFWTYTCCSPNYPYASNHLDDDCLSMRVMGWMEKAFDINGYLFFMANMYAKEKDSSVYSDPYTIADRNDAANGDGYIMYPGRPYGSPTPFPSMRLITYRDGLEDYDMLDIYERKIKAACEKYGVTDLDTHEYVSDLYSSLFTNAVPTEDHASLYKAREKLAERILNFDDSVLLYPKNENNEMTLKIFSTESEISIDGIKNSGEATLGGHYQYSYPLGSEPKDIVILANGKTFTYHNPGYKNLTNFQSSSVIVETSDYSSFVKEGSTIHASINSYEGEEVRDTINFTPYFAVKGVDLSNVKKLFFQYENASSTTDLSFDVDLLTPIKTVTVGGHYCIRGGKKTIEIDLSKTRVKLEEVEEINLSFPNYYFDEDGAMQVYDVRDLVINDIYGAY